jgi:hypothetical protein
MMYAIKRRTIEAPIVSKRVLGGTWINSEKAQRNKKGIRINEIVAKRWTRERYNFGRCGWARAIRDF